MDKGRKPLLTLDRAADILELVEVGNYVETACAACGVSDASYYLWLKKGRQVAQEYPDMAIDEWKERWDEADEGSEVRPTGLSDHEWHCYVFHEAAKKATARAEAYAVAIVRKHMPDQWTAAMTYLERRYPGRWKRRDQHDIGPASQGPDEREQAILDDPDAVSLIHEALVRVALPQKTDSPT